MILFQSIKSHQCSGVGQQPQQRDLIGRNRVIVNLDVFSIPPRLMESLLLAKDLIRRPVWYRVFQGTLLLLLRYFSSLSERSNSMIKGTFSLDIFHLNPNDISCLLNFCWCSRTDGHMTHSSKSENFFSFILSFKNVRFTD